MIDILENMRDVLLEEEIDEIIRDLKKIGCSKRRDSKVVVDDKT